MQEQEIQGFRLSPQQRRLWLLSRGSSLAEGTGGAILIEGPLAPEPLAWAVGRLVGRHEILRTRFRRLAGMPAPVQMVAGDGAPVLERIDLRGMAPEEQKTAADQAFRNEISRPFDLEAGPVVRTSLLELAPERHLLLATLCPLCGDGWTLDNLLRELRDIYENCLQGGPEPEAAFRYVQFSDWQNALLEEEEDEELLRFWLEREPSAAPSLPFRLGVNGRAPDPEPPVVVNLAACEVEEAEVLARNLGASSGTFFLACWQALLAKLTGDPRVVVGELYGFRDDDLLADAFGLFAKYLPVLSRCERALRFSELLAAVDEERSRTRELADSLIWGGGERLDDGRPQAIPYGFEVFEWPEKTWAGPVTFSLAARHAAADHCELELSCRRTGDGWTLALSYNALHFRRGDVEALARQLRTLVRRVVGAPDSPLSRLEILDEAELRRIVVEQDATAATQSGGALVHELFAEQAALRPEAMAAVIESRSLTYGELDQRANQLAHGLRRAGVGPDVLVALCVERSLEMVVGLLGILKAGGAYAPIDPDQPRRRLDLLLYELGAEILLTQEHLATSLGGGRTQMISMDREGKAFSALPETDPRVQVAGENLAYVVFTSGSTGRPKGVAVEHRQLRSYLQAAVTRLDLPSGASYATVSTFAADLGNTMIFPALTTGGCLHLVTQERATDPTALGELFRRHRIDCLKIVPSHMEVLLGGAEPAAVLPQCRLVLGGEALRWPLAEELGRLVPGGCGIFNHYGPSETTVGVAALLVSGRFRDSRCATVPIGTPLPNSRIYLLDADLSPVPDWVPGELYIGGQGISRGYLRDPATTAGSFVVSPFGSEPGSRLYRTGDLARRLPDGTIEFLGRRDHQVKLHGVRIELGEIRAALNEYPDVRDSVVTAVRDEGDRDVLIAYYLSRQGLDTGALREHLKGRVLEAAIPQYFHHLKRLPLTLNGKVNVKALPDLAEVKASVRRTVVPPRTSVEELLAGMWAELLRLPRVSATDNFFELGGHSLLATQVLSRVRQVFAVELPLRSLFEAPSVAGLAAKIESALRAGYGLVVPPVEPVSRQGELPLSYAQERLWIMHQLDPDSPAYNVPLALALAGPLRVPELLRSLREVERRHEVLRTLFPVVDGQPLQSMSPVPLSRPTVVDLSALDGGRQEAEARRLTREESQSPFFLARGPLLRLTLLALGRESYRLLFTLHHIVSDAWSMNILVREVTVLYQAFSEGLPSPLPPLSLQYADFAHWQRRWLEAGGLEPQLAYWRRQLRGASELLSLPTDRPRPPVRTFVGGTLIRGLPTGLTSPLRDLSRKEGVTLFMTLLAAFDVLLQRATGQEELVVGTDVANRNQLETEKLIGFFINNLVLRTSLAGDPTFRELLARVRDVALGAYTHQDLPFDRLVKELAPQRALDRTPLFQILFVHQNAPASALDLPGLRLSWAQDEITTSKFDLSLFVREAGDQFAAVWTYSADLFDRATIERMACHFERLLESLRDEPDRRVSALEMFSDEEKRRQMIERDERQDEKIRRIRSIRRQSVDLEEVSLVRTGPLEPGTTLPLLVQPEAADVDLLDWAVDNRELLEAELLRHGALLFRGAGGTSVSAFERFAQSLTPDLFGEYGDLPGEEQGEKVYQSTPYPPDKVLLFHNESSHMHRWPLKQWFFCVTAARQGGETPIVDCRQVYRELAPRILAPFAGKGLLYERNFIPGIDVAWQDFFRTDSREAVEGFCRAAGIECEWRGDRLRTRQVCPAVARHPGSGEPVFFNQIMLHHVSSLEPELRESVLAVFGEEGLPRNVYYGDGTPIDDAVVAEITRLYWRLAVCFPWQAGDILMVDNMLVAHARNPFTGPRKIVVAMGEMFGKEQLS